MSPLIVVIDIVLILIAIALIIAVLMQQGQRQGLGAIGGGAETFFGKNKAKGYEAKLAKITKIGAVVFTILAIVGTIVTAHNPIEEEPFVYTDPTTGEEIVIDGETEGSEADETVDGTEVDETSEGSEVDETSEGTEDEPAE